MSELSRLKMLKKYKYLTNTTESAKKRLLPEKELLCSICGEPITQQDSIENCEAIVNNSTWRFFHRTCVK